MLEITEALINRGTTAVDIAKVGLETDALDVNEEIEKAAVRGDRPDTAFLRQEFRDNDVQKLLQACWHVDRKQRPSFAQITSRLGEIIEQLVSIRAGAVVAKKLVLEEVEASPPPSSSSSAAAAAAAAAAPTSPFVLPQGWRKEVVPRKNSQSRGADTYYYDPAGKKYRSIPEVKAALAV